MIQPPRDLATVPGWHWLKGSRGAREPWRWLPAEQVWVCGNLGMSALNADVRGYTYWAPMADAPATPYVPPSLFNESKRRKG